ncbi:hypothetical protein AB0I49_00610 [Streptomyces sp. NPDC050617]|uniref:hypothetical protein n=1 Tax=Streptomyces sp. NPDC050617 TaxID=3154628 RepID=UPI00343EE05A
MRFRDIITYLLHLRKLTCVISEMDCRELNVRPVPLLGPDRGRSASVTVRPEVGKKAIGALLSQLLLDGLDVLFRSPTEPLAASGDTSHLAEDDGYAGCAGISLHPSGAVDGAVESVEKFAENGGVAGPFAPSLEIV